MKKTKCGVLTPMITQESDTTKHPALKAKYKYSMGHVVTLDTEDILDSEQEPENTPIQRTDDHEVGELQDISSEVSSQNRYHLGYRIIASCSLTSEVHTNICTLFLPAFICEFEPVGRHCSESQRWWVITSSVSGWCYKLIVSMTDPGAIWLAIWTIRW